MIRRLGHHFAAFFRQVMPDPFVLAVVLTFVVFGLAMALTGSGPVEVLGAWQGPRGFWSLLAFAMQMALILVTGHALASTVAVQRVLRALARLPRTGAQAAALVAAVAIFASLLNWGLGLIVGALLAREVGLSCKTRSVAAHYPLLAASGYAGLSTWHGGLSGTAPLKVTTRGDLVQLLGAEIGGSVEPMSFSDTVFSGFNLLITGGLWVLVPCVCFLLAPRGDEPVETIADFAPGAPFDPNDDSQQGEHDSQGSFVSRLETGPALVWLLAVPLIASLVLWVRAEGLGRLNPNVLNLAFLTAGLLLHGSLRRYQQALTNAINGTTGILLQFPFYAGIMGVMHGTGLAAKFAAAVAGLGSAKMFAVGTFLSAGLINLFVPSGGGQWAVQGPIALRAAAELGVAPELAVMTVAYGDQWTNLLQPFWALPLLGITGVKARDLLGYTAVILLASGVWVVGCLLMIVD
jgi:short-chain fatty acids transporter